MPKDWDVVEALRDVRGEQGIYIPFDLDEYRLVQLLVSQDFPHCIQDADNAIVEVHQAAVEVFKLRQEPDTTMQQLKEAEKKLEEKCKTTGRANERVLKSCHFLLDGHIRQALKPFRDTISKLRERLDKADL